MIKREQILYKSNKTPYIEWIIKTGLRKGTKIKMLGEFRNCKGCGAPFFAYKTSIKKGYGKFCSQLSSCEPIPTFAEPITLTASWYSTESLKKEGTYAYSKGYCADGSKFNEKSLTCATRLFPLGTILKVSGNGRSVYVKVTDRIGKRFANTRIDLSKKAFGILAPLSQGLLQVKVEVTK